MFTTSRSGNFASLETQAAHRHDVIRHLRTRCSMLEGRAGEIEAMPGYKSLDVVPHDSRLNRSDKSNGRLKNSCTSINAASGAPAITTNIHSQESKRTTKTKRVEDA